MTTSTIDRCRCWNEGQWGRVYREDCPIHGDQTKGDAVEAGNTPNIATSQRINTLLADLLKDGKADVSDLSIKDIITVAGALGWTDSPRVEFNGEHATLMPPGRRRSRVVGSVDPSQKAPQPVSSASVGGGPQA